MDILYGIQGTGNGHISRARAIIPSLQKFANVDILISGHSVDMKLDYPISYSFTGLGYSFGRNGGIDYLDTVLNLHPASFIRDVQQLPVHNYDIVISDFEPVTAWACWLADKPCVGLSHQSSFLSEKTPRPKKEQILGEFIFRNYAPVSIPIGFHFEMYDDFILTPVIRNEIRNLNPSNGHHITVYLPAYHHSYLASIFQKMDQHTHIFSKQCKFREQHGNVTILPVSEEAYLQSLTSCSIFVCGAGFEAPSEGLFLGKKMICIPMKDQYEQKCNAEALRQKGIETADKANESLLQKIATLQKQPAPERILFPDVMDEIIERVLQTALRPNDVAG